MPRMNYGQQSLDYPDRPAVYDGGSARQIVSRALRQAWADPSLDALRAQLSNAARQTVAPAYSRAAQGIRRAYSDAARSSGYADQVRRIWNGF
jgi:hypothetical protein